jgi:hypothetical protein
MPGRVLPLKSDAMTQIIGAIAYHEIALVLRLKAMASLHF